MAGPLRTCAGVLSLLVFGSPAVYAQPSDGVDMDLTEDADAWGGEPPADEAPSEPSQADPSQLEVAESEPSPGETPLAGYLKHIELGGALGWALPVSQGELDPFGLTVVGRGGLSWTNNLYTGAAVVVHLGSSEDRFPFRGVETQRDIFMTQLGLEVGFDLLLPTARVRPYGGLGLNHQVTTTRGGVIAESLTVASDAFYASAGCQAHWALPAGFYLGADGRLTVVLGNDTLVGLVLAVAGGYQL